MIRRRRGAAQYKGEVGSEGYTDARGSSGLKLCAAARRPSLRAGCAGPLARGRGAFIKIGRRLVARRRQRQQHRGKGEDG